MSSASGKTDTADFDNFPVWNFNPEINKPMPHRVSINKVAAFDVE